MNRPALRILIGFVLVTSLLLVREYMLMPDGRVHAVFLDVGQGDSALLTLEDGSRMLIDGGPDWSTLQGLGERMPFFDRTIDVVVLSHPNADHMASLPEVLRRYRVRTLMTAGTVFDSGLYDAVLDTAKKQGVRLLVLHAGDDVSVGGADIRTVWPPAIRPPKMSKNENNDSLTLMVTAGRKRILFTGDLESIVERTLVEAKADLKADILKVPHHGSKSSSSTGFLLAVDPDIAVVSVGRDNSYGHPSAAVIRRLEAMGVTVRRTDVEGVIELVW